MVLLLLTFPRVDLNRAPLKGKRFHPQRHLKRAEQPFRLRWLDEGSVVLVLLAGSEDVDLEVEVVA